MAWADFLERFAWRQGEHVALVGPTGTGKTTLALAILPRRAYSVVIGTKPKDRTLDRLQRTDGYLRIRSWPPPNADIRRVLLWPPFRALGDTRRQAAVLRDAIGGIFAQGGWCLFADDVQYLQRQLGLAGELATLWLQARSVRITVVAATQRPRWVPREMWSQSTHLFIWHTSDPDDLRSLAGLGGADTRQVREAVQGLGLHECLYVNTRTGDLLVTSVDLEGKAP